MNSMDRETKQLLRWMQLLKFLILGIIVLFFSTLYVLQWGIPAWISEGEITTGEVKEDSVSRPNPLFVQVWTAPSDWRLDRLSKDQREEIQYGKELISHTAAYLGPNGTVAHLSNGMNCQNCHVQAGQQPWGNNYFAVASTYPKFRARSGMVESQAKRVNDCFERSLNGRALDTTSREMQAILAYMRWLGSDVKKGTVPKGSGIFKLAVLDRAADPIKGKTIYQAKCQSCHQEDGGGLKNGKEYTYPPLWGEHSYNDGAGLYRLSNFAGYVKYNMPLGATYETPQLTDEEAWDLAAFVNSMPRPKKDIQQDWPKISEKPFDHPFGPYADPFSEDQHKFGPFGPIQKWKKEHSKSK
ncbi:MAG: c-type cytochrome [Spirosomataceae bacterium]